MQGLAACLFQTLFLGVFSATLAAPAGKLPTDAQAEVMISRSETAAIGALQSLIKKNPNNPDLLLRLAELYNRKSRTSRFFELSRESSEKAATLQLVGELDKNAKGDFKMAIQIYEKILKNYPKYASNDTVLFHAGYDSQALGDRANANRYYQELVARFPTSLHVPDADLALGENAYEAQNFIQAQKYYDEVGKFPTSKVYAYSVYKNAWALYNQKKNQAAIDALVRVVKLFGELNASEQRHNLRPEALRDLSLFYGEIHTAQEAYQFFSELCTAGELGESLLQLGKLYLAHNREKEMNVFLNDYITRTSPSPQTTVRAYLLLAEANEHLKKMDEVTIALSHVSDICKKQNLTECDENFTHYVHELSRRMWDQWIKTKKDSSLAENTKKVLQLRIDSESKTNPDLPAHNILADLQFQMGQFAGASVSYEWISDHATDVQMKQETLYSSIVSEQKAGTPDSNNRLLSLTEKFLKQFPQGKDAESVQFVRGFTQYTLKKDGDAEKTLTLLAASAKDAGLKTKSQDLVLDIMNRGQRFADLKKTSLTYSGASDKSRATTLEKLSAEADFSDVQKKTAASPAREKFQQLMTFYQQNQDKTDLANQALYEAIALAYASGLDLDGASASFEYAKKNQDEKSKKALSDAALIFLENGFFEEGLKATEKLLTMSDAKEALKWQRVRADLYFLLGKNREALSSTLDLASHLPTAERVDLLGQMYLKFKNAPSGEESSLLTKRIKDDAIEPYYSELTLIENQKLLEQKKWTEAFNLAKQIMGRKTSDLNRARARLIQAAVLQKEFFEQSLHTTVTRLNLVLGLKTEKLEKAQEAFLNAQKISSDPEIHAKSVEGLRDSYVHFIESLKSLRLKNELAEADQKALEGAIQHIIDPMSLKLKDFEAQLASIAKAESSARVARIDYENLSPDTVWTPPLPNFTLKSDSFVVPRGLWDARLFSSLVRLKKLNEALSLGRRITKENPKNFEGIFYQAVVYQVHNELDKSDYLLSVLNRKSEFKKEAHFYQALIELKRGNNAHAQKLFADNYLEGVSVRETKVAELYSLYAQKQYAGLIDTAKLLSKSDLASSQMIPALAEALAVQGQSKEAWDLVSATKGNDVNLLLTRAHLAENFDFDFLKAQKFYEKAASTSSDSSLNHWITRKIEWLKNNKEIHQASSPKSKNPERVATTKEENP